MTKRFSIFAGLFAAFVLGLATANLGPSTAAVAQAPGNAAGRYQVSAYGATTGGGSVSHGCYLVDTATGQVWYASLGGSLQKVAERLP